MLNNIGYPVAFYPKLVKIVGGVKEAIFVSQILYWQSKSTDGWVFRTQKQIEDETGLTPREQTSIRKKLKRESILIETKEGMPLRTFYQVNINLLNDLLNKLKNDKSFEKQGNSPDMTICCNNNLLKQPNVETRSYDLLKQQNVVSMAKSRNSEDNNNIETNIETNKEKKERNIINKERKESKTNLTENDDSKIHQFEPKKFIKDVANSLKLDTLPAITPDVEETLIQAMWRCGFPRKTLRSRIDRENLETLRIHLGATTYDQLIGFFEKLALLRAKGFLVEWDWEKILKKADYIATYEPMPEIDFNRYDNWRALLTYFITQKPPAMYVRKIVWGWWKFHKFTDIDYNWIEKFIAKIMKEAYGINEAKKENSNGNVLKV